MMKIENVTVADVTRVAYALVEQDRALAEVSRQAAEAFADAEFAAEVAAQRALDARYVYSEAELDNAYAADVEVRLARLESE